MKCFQNIFLPMSETEQKILSNVLIEPPAPPPFKLNGYSLITLSSGEYMYKLKNFGDAENKFQFWNK